MKSNFQGLLILFSAPSPHTSHRYLEVALLSRETLDNLQCCGRCTRGLALQDDPSKFSQ